MQWITQLFEQYGYLVLFFGLFTESIALPFPGELAMAVSGHISVVGNFHLGWILLCAFLGATIGTTLTYYVGRKLGTPFFEKYGKYFFLTPSRLAKITIWFDKYGTKLLLVSYFIPGLRHFTGYVSGALRIPVRTFFLYNHFSALIWVTVYVMIGKLFGNEIEHILHLIGRYSVRAVFIIAALLVIVILLKRHKQTVLKWLTDRFKSLYKAFVRSQS
ncbi:DedA family protein [Paenibacillus nasutitermitis]|uniref:Alkaline phosphatase n=1 Tax=Paenibacillus nasutitermitis TaxID=1652958 RepID=A0A917E1N5_9BACL|nr:DedA family protein [Paenibacillus nasutitermitis]GGD93101.1 alkaline phosphatase [Paenibacillus nasutitermitis]